MGGLGDFASPRWDRSLGRQPVRKGGATSTTGCLSSYTSPGDTILRTLVRLHLAQEIPDILATYALLSPNLSKSFAR